MRCHQEKASGISASGYSGKEGSMKKYIIGIAVALFIIIDLVIVLYPTIGNYFNDRNQSRAVALYLNEVAEIDDSKARSLLSAARDYNERLLQKQNRFDLNEAESEEYQRQLRTNRDVMGILAIDKLDVKLAIYHGTEEGTLQIGLGHIPGTSLPVGGDGTHSFITGHRGVPSSKLLTDLDKMSEGDLFVLYVMGETLTYQVDDIQTVEPHEMESVQIDMDKDYCTLVTCTPYGINSHRLLVRGHRVENMTVTEWDSLRTDAKWLDKFFIILIFLAPVLPVLIIYFIYRCNRIRKEGTVRR
jgi:sortase A